MVKFIAKLEGKRLLALRSTKDILDILSVGPFVPIQTDHSVSVFLLSAATQTEAFLVH